MVTAIVPIGPALVYSITTDRFTRARMLAHFQRLLDDLPSVREIAAAIASPNPEDDLMIRTAIAGYCYHQAAESWGGDELDSVSRRRSGVADFDPLWIEFVCLASGYLLGLYQAGMLRGVCPL